MMIFIILSNSWLMNVTVVIAVIGVIVVVVVVVVDLSSLRYLMRVPAFNQLPLSAFLFCRAYLWSPVCCTIVYIYVTMAKP